MTFTNTSFQEKYLDKKEIQIHALYSQKEEWE